MKLEMVRVRLRVDGRAHNLLMQKILLTTMEFVNLNVVDLNLTLNQHQQPFERKRKIALNSSTQAGAGLVISVNLSCSWA
jgi:hypothetical protein